MEETMISTEVRSIRTPLEIREEGGTRTIVGYASTFDQPYPVDMVTEIIDRSAFTRTLTEKPDVYALIGHDPSRILGRTKNGTLSLSVDERGLKCVITPVMTRDAEDTIKLIESGCIDAMSFGFKVVRQAFGYADGKTTRRITDLELHEVSCVAFPANENATLSLRDRRLAEAARSGGTSPRMTKFVADYDKSELKKVYDGLREMGATFPQSAQSEDTYLRNILKKFDGDVQKTVDYIVSENPMWFKKRSSSTRLEKRESRTPQTWTVKHHDGDLYVENDEGDVASITDGYENEAEALKFIGAKSINDVKAIANYLESIDFAHSGDTIVSGSHKYTIRSRLTLVAPLASLEKRSDDEDEEVPYFEADSHEERGEWTLWVRDPNGQIVYDFRTDPEDPENNPVTDGFLKHDKDLQGLANYMAHLGAMKKGDYIRWANKPSSKGLYARSSATRLEKRGKKRKMKKQ